MAAAAFLTDSACVVGAIDGAPGDLEDALMKGPVLGQVRVEVGLSELGIGIRSVHGPNSPTVFSARGHYSRPRWRNAPGLDAVRRDATARYDPTGFPFNA